MIAIIAGTGTLPLEACKNLRAQGKQFFVVSLFPELNGLALQECTAGFAEVIARPFYKPSIILEELKKRSTTHALLIGKVDKGLLFKKIKFDWFALSFLASVITKSDQALMERVVALFAEHGIAIIKQDCVLGSLMVAPGFVCGTLDATLEQNIAFGMQQAKQLATLDIGQTVVVKDMMILAVEAIEGTDACIKRGIELGKSQIIVCKAAHVQQNKKFDLPTLGPETLRSVAPNAIRVIAWQADATFIAQKEAFIAQARKLGITLLAC